MLLPIASCTSGTTCCDLNIQQRIVAISVAVQVLLYCTGQWYAASCPVGQLQQCQWHDSASAHDSALGALGSKTFSATKLVAGFSMFTYILYVALFVRYTKAGTQAAAEEAQPAKVHALCARPGALLIGPMDSGRYSFIYFARYTEAGTQAAAAEEAHPAKVHALRARPGALIITTLPTDSRATARTPCLCARRALRCPTLGLALRKLDHHGVTHARKRDLSVQRQDRILRFSPLVELYKAVRGCTQRRGVDGC